MPERFTALLLHALRVPTEPHPPHGDPASLRVFRAGRNYLHLRLVGWGLAQAGALLGIVFWFLVFSDLGDRVEERRQRDAQLKPAAAAPAPAAGDNAIDRFANRFAAEFTELTQGAKPERKQAERTRKRLSPLEMFHGWRNRMVLFLSRLPPWTMLVLWCFEIGGVLLYLVQLPVTFLLTRLDYALRWYMVTDRSLRIRHGIWTISESTMSFANIQQVVVSQGPLQRLLGLSDVKVQSAGGGGGEEGTSHDRENDMHLGLFHSVTNPAEIRDLILERLRRYRESGLGDPEEQAPAVPAPPPTPDVSSAGELLFAARELAAASKALRAALTAPPPAAPGSPESPATSA